MSISEKSSTFVFVKISLINLLQLRKSVLDIIATKQRFFFYFLLILFVGIQLFFNFLSPQFVSDSRMHLLIAQNILQGFGHSFIEANPEDISKVREVAINFWPPGYSLMLIPFLLIGLKGWHAIAVSDAVAIIIFYWCWYKIIKVNFPTKYKVFTATLFFFFTFAYTPLGMHYAFGTNIWALLWFSLAVLQFSKMVKGKQFLSYTTLFSYYLFLFLAVFFRYSYYPVGIVMSFGLLFLFYKTENFKRVGLSLIVPFFLFLTFLLFQNSQFGNLNYIETFHEQQKETFHFENLKKTSAIVSNSFLHPMLYKSTNWFSSLDIFLKNSGDFNIKQWINGIFKYSFTLFLAFFILISCIQFYLKQDKRIRYRVLFGASVLIGQFLFFVFLSLKYPAEIFRGIYTISTWTYVEEVRYFNAINLMILVFGLYFMFQFKANWLKAIMVFIVIFNFWSFFKAKAYLSNNPEENIKKRNFWVLQTLPDSLVPADAVVYEKELKQRKSNYHFVSVIYAEKKIPILKFRSPDKIKTSKPVTLIMIIDKIENDGGDAVFKNIIQKNDAYKLGYLFDTNITVWGVKIKPGQRLLL